MPAVMCPRCARTVLLSYWELALPCIQCARCDGCFIPAVNLAPLALAGPVRHCWECGVFTPASLLDQRFTPARRANLCTRCAAKRVLWRWASATVLTVLACVALAVLTLSYLARR